MIEVLLTILLTEPTVGNVRTEPHSINLLHFYSIRL